MNANRTIEKTLASKADAICAVSDSVWDFAETRFNLPRSADALIAAAEKEGFRVTRGVAGMDDAFVAEWGDGNPRFGVLAEYDALANLGLEAGRPGHGCGHNLLGAGALAGAIGAKALLEESGKKGTILLFGCPSEESGYGKAFMARAGAFDGLDAALSWHPWNVNAGWSMSSLAVSQMYFVFKGISAHAAAAPEQGRSALDAAELMNIGVNFLREHIIDSGRVHYAFVDAGGESANVVQPTACLYYFIRAPKQAQVREIYERVEKIARGAALMTETEVNIVWDSSIHDYLPNRALTAVMHEKLGEFLPLDLTGEELASAAELAGERGGKAGTAGAAVSAPVRTDLEPLSFDVPMWMASTDVGDVSWAVPTAQMMIACEPAGTPPHSWQWTANGKSGLAHKGVLLAGKTIAATIGELLDNPSLLAHAREEHARNTGGMPYRSALPPDAKPGGAWKT